MSAIEKRTKIFDCQVHVQQFPVKQVIFLEKGKTVSCTIYDLLQDCSDCCVRCIH